VRSPVQHSYKGRGECFAGTNPSAGCNQKFRTPLKRQVRAYAVAKAVQTIKRLTGRLTRLLHPTERSSDSVRRLLIVDDEQAICFSMSQYFTHYGFLVDTASEIEQAEGLIRRSSYEVIIQDLRLGTANNTAGLEIIRYAQQHSPHTRIIVLTAHATADIENEARKSGAVAFLRKPQRLSQLAQVVSNGH